MVFAASIGVNFVCLANNKLQGSENIVLRFPSLLFSHNGIVTLVSECGLSKIA